MGSTTYPTTSKATAIKMEMGETRIIASGWSTSDSAYWICVYEGHSDHLPHVGIAHVQKDNGHTNIKFLDEDMGPYWYVAIPKSVRDAMPFTNNEQADIWRNACWAIYPRKEAIKQAMRLYTQVGPTEPLWDFMRKHNVRKITPKMQFDYYSGGNK